MKCNLCGSENYNIIATEIREGDGLIAECSDCHHIFQLVDMNEQELEDYYNKIYIETNSLQESKIDVQNHFNDRKKTLGKLLSHIKPFLKPNDDVLDIGAGAVAIIL